MKILSWKVVLYMSHYGCILTTVRVCHIINMVWPLFLQDAAAQWVRYIERSFLEFDYHEEYDWRQSTVTSEATALSRCRLV